MINLRYHIVSIVAVFLALGIGVALGSSFVDGFVVDTLRRNVDALEGERNDLRDQVGALGDELDATRTAHDAELDRLLRLAITNRLGDRPVMIIANQGVDPADWETVRNALLTASASYEGTVWLSDRFDLSNEDNRVAMAETFDLVNSNRSLVEPALFLRLQASLFRGADDVGGTALGDVVSGVVEDLVDSDTELSTTSQAARLSDALVVLRDAGFISFDNEFARTGVLADVPAVGTTYVIIGSGEVALTPDQFLIPFLLDAVDDGVDVDAVVVEPRPSDLENVRDAYVGAFRSEPVLSELLGTVDTATSLEGLLATVLLTQSLDAVHLGLADSASAELPTP